MSRANPNVARFVSLLILGAVGALPPSLPASPDSAAAPPPRPNWKPGDGWHLSLTAFPRNGPPRQFDLHVTVTAAVKLGSADCWRLEYNPISAPAGYDVGHRVLVDKLSGAVRKAWVRRPPAELRLPSPDALLSPAFPAALPVEVLPLAADDPKSAARAVRPVPRREGTDVTWWEARLPGDEAALTVKQKWVDGQGWWEEYERWRGDHKELVGTRAPPRPAPTPAPPPGPAHRADPRLALPITETINEPSVAAVLAHLQDVTGVPLTTEPRADFNRPFGYTIAYQGLPAWRVMEQTAALDLVRGQWEQDGDGYRLVPGPPPARGWSVRDGLTVALSALIAAVGVVLLVRRKWSRPAASPRVPAGSGA